MRIALFAAAILLGACQADAPPAAEPAAALGAWSGHAFGVETADGAVDPVLLAGVISPPPSSAGADAARAALEAVLGDAGANLVLIDAEAGRDRYGRRIVFARYTHDERTIWLDAELVRSGHVVVWPRAGADRRAAILLPLEAEARAERRGAWGEGGFEVRDPDPDRLAQVLDSAQIVEGRVVSTGAARSGRVYLNFGLNWRSDFTVSASADTVEAFQREGIDLMALEGAVIRARGWLYEENGPMIALATPAQLELVDAPALRPLR